METEKGIKPIINSFIITCSFITVLPVKNYPEWNRSNLRFFCIMLPATGALVGLLWFLLYLILGLFTGISYNLRGVIMVFWALLFTGGLHMDGLIDTCDAVFSHSDIKTRLKILSDTHVGAFGVMGCVSDLILKSALFGELFLKPASGVSIFLIPVWSRIGMGLLLNNLPFAKDNGLANLLGGARHKNDNFYFIIIIICLSILNFTVAASLFVMLIFWWRYCMKSFGGITGDLLGAFVEVSEAVILASLVFSKCI